jgi:hypothetical protein
MVREETSDYLGCDGIAHIDANWGIAARFGSFDFCHTTQLYFRCKCLTMNDDQTS